MKSRINKIIILLFMSLIISLCQGHPYLLKQLDIQIRKRVFVDVLDITSTITFIKQIHLDIIRKGKLLYNFFQFLQEIKHDHGKDKAKNYSGQHLNSNLGTNFEEKEKKTSYTSSELLKEQYEVKNKFNQKCGSFNTSDVQQWPVSEIDTSQYAQRLFAFHLKDPKDIYDIIVNKKEIDAIYWTQIVGKLQLWIIMIIMCLIGQCICCCQIFCLPELKILRRCCQIDFNKESESTWEKNIYFFLIVIFGGLIFFVGGCVFMASDIEISQTQLQCTILWSQKVLLGVDQQSIPQIKSQNLDNLGHQYHIQYEMQESQSSNNITDNNITWVANYGGIDVIKFQLQELSKFFDTISEHESVQQIKQINVAPFNEEYKQVQQKIPQFYEKHKDKTLVNPNASEYPYQIKSEFIESIGPLQTIGTIGWSLVKELNSRKYKINFVNEVQKHTTHLEDVSPKISESALNARSEMDSITYLANNYLKEIDTLIDYYNPLITQGVDYIEKYFEVVMFMVFCGLVGFIFVAWPKFNSCAILLHLSWYCSTCVLIVGFVLCLIMFSIGLILNNGVCTAAENFLHNPNFLQSEGIETSQKLKQCLNYCVYRNKKNKIFFEVQNYLKEIETLEYEIDSFQSLSLSKQSLNSKINYVNNVLSNEKFAALEPSVQATQNMNDWSDYSLNSSQQTSKGSCNVSRDQWIWSDNDCTYSTIIEPNKESDFDLGFTVCLRIMKQTEQFVNERYTQKEFDQCKVDVGQQIIKRFQAIQKYRDSVKSVFNLVLEDLNDYNTQVDKLDIDIDKVSGKLKNLKKEFTNMFNMVTFKNKGLQKTLDCSFVRDTVQRAKNSVCISGLNGVLLYTVFFIASSTTLIFFSLFVCISAARILPNKDEEIQKQMMASNLYSSSFVLNSQRVPFNPNDSEQNRKDQRRDSNNNSNDLVYYKSNLQKNNIVFSDQEQQSNLQSQQQHFKEQLQPFKDSLQPFKESDNSFLKQPINQQLVLIDENDNDSSYHSAQNNFDYLNNQFKHLN